MISFFAQSPTKNYRNEPKSKSVTLIFIIIAVFTLNSCATKGTVTLGDMKVYGANEIWIYEPVRE